MYPTGANIDGIDVDEIITRSDLIKPVYTIEMLRKYVAYSKRITPIMTDEAREIITNSYLRIRKMGNGGNSVPITARQLEAFVRLSEASAKMRLSSTVTDVDANRAVDLVEYYLRKIAGNDDGGFDIDKIASGVSSKDRNRLSIVRDIFSKYGDEGLTMDLLIKYGTDEGLDEAEVTRAVKSLSDGAEIIRTTTGEYRRV
jgi:replicative DNA helicase Mcm